MAKLTIENAVITTLLSELEAGDIFKMNNNFYIMSYVTNPGHKQGTIKQDFYKASTHNSITGKTFVITNLETGEVSLEYFNYEVSKADAKLLINYMREND